MKKKIKSSYFSYPIYSKEKKMYTKLNQERETILHLDKLRFAECFIGEHVTDEYERISSSMIFISSLISETNRIMLGTGTVNLPNYNPAYVASNISMLDHMSKGRLIFGIGPGSLISDAEVFGTLNKSRNEMFLESINHILNIWKSKPPYLLKGKHWEISTKKTYDKKIGIGSIANTYQKPHPEIVCTSLSTNEASFKGLLSRGWGLISSNILRESSLKFHNEFIKKYNRSKKFKWRIARYIFVNDNEKFAKNYINNKNGAYYNSIKQIFLKLKKYNRLNILKKNPFDKNEKIDLEKLVNELVIHGTKKIVAEKLQNIVKDFENLYAISYTGVDLNNKNLSNKSLKLFNLAVKEIK